jgi:hypothetical protein
MAAKLPTGLIMTTALAALLPLAACGGSDQPQAEATTTVAPRDEDGLTPDEREVADAVEAYTDAYFERGATKVGPAIKDLVTQEVYDLIVPAETKSVDGAGLQHLGKVALTVDKVTIDDDTAVYRGCQDASKSFLVRKGDTSPGVGSTTLGFTRMEYGLAREDGVWVVSDPRSEQVASC